MEKAKISGSTTPTLYCKQLENVNGDIVTLSVQKSTNTSSRQERRFTIRFGVIQPRGGTGTVTKVLPRFALIAAIVFNVFAIAFAKSSFNALIFTASILTVIALFWVTHTVQYESILVVPRVGIQNSIKYVLGKEENFIPWNSIEDVIINEVIHLNRVLYYLTVLVQESEEIKLVPLFKYTKPRLSALESIYSEIQTLTAKMGDGTQGGGGDI